MATTPTLLRTVLVSAMPDTNWPSAQTSPGAANLVDVTTARTVGVMFVALDNAGVVVNPSGTVDIQPVTIATSAAIPDKGVASTTIITGGAPDTGVAGGIGLTYSTRGAPLFTARVASNGAGLGGTVDRIDIYWNAID